MNDDYKRGYADAMNWKVQNHLEHLPSKEQAPMNYYRADVEGNLERTDIHFAQRTWVGLTPQERDEINEQVYGAVPHHVAFHAAIEQALREKNT